MKQKLGYVLMILMLVLGIWLFVSGKPAEWYYFLMVAVLLITVFFFTKKNPFDKLTKSHKFFISVLSVVIVLLGFELNHSPYYLLFIFLPACFMFYAWEERLYEKEITKAVEKAFSKKRPEDVQLALELLSYENRYLRFENGPIWFNELQKMTKE